MNEREVKGGLFARPFQIITFLLPMRGLSKSLLSFGPVVLSHAHTYTLSLGELTCWLRCALAVFCPARSIYRRSFSRQFRPVSKPRAFAVIFGLNAAHPGNESRKTRIIDALLFYAVFVVVANRWVMHTCTVCTQSRGGKYCVVCVVDEDEKKRKKEK